MATDHGSTLKDFALDPNHHLNKIEYLYARPFHLLETACYHIRHAPRSWNVSSKSAGAGLYEVLADRSQMSRGRKDREYSYVLIDVLLEVFLSTQLAMPSGDEFSQGMRQSFLGDVVLLWVVSAHQIYLEIHRILREQIDRGLKESRVAKTR